MLGRAGARPRPRTRSRTSSSPPSRTSGDRLVIVIHDDGVRELSHFARRKLDRPASVLRLSDGEARQIAGIIGGLTYVPRSLPMAEVVLEDLVLE